jgi:hypothetical protein
VLRTGITYDPGELRALEGRINGSIRALGDRKLFDKIAVLADKENRRSALSGLDRNDAPLRRWKTRRGDSDYHGEDYASWTNSTVLVPFGTRSRRIDAFLVRADRERLLGFGVGNATIFVGFSARAGRIPAYWRAQGRDVLGLSPRTQRALSLLLRVHSSDAHGLLRRGRRAVSSFLGF